MATLALTPNPVLATPVKKRIDSIDVLRGLVMVLMALDHTRDFFCKDTFDATNLTVASTFAFLTRFVTHYCAACFVFLAGTGAYLSLSRGKTIAQASRFLLSRGLWLVFLEFTIIGFGFTLQPPLTFGFLQVIWVIGISMIVLSALIYLPFPIIAAFGLVMIAGHNLLDGIKTASLSPAVAIEWQFLHTGGPVKFKNGVELLVLYPLIPWIGVMAAGYSFGKIYKLDALRRRKLLLAIGSAAIVLFIILRSGNYYGDNRPWQQQEVWYRSILSFINVQKYPPSLDYLLITLGPAMIFLALIENTHNWLTRILVVFGRVPLFYYILHIYLIHVSSGIVYLYQQAHHIPTGFTLPVVYLIWFAVVFILYFPSLWFMKLRQRRTDWWLSYL